MKISHIAEEYCHAKRETRLWYIWIQILKYTSQWTPWMKMAVLWLILVRKLEIAQASY